MRTRVAAGLLTILVAVTLSASAPPLIAQTGDSVLVSSTNPVVGLPLSAGDMGEIKLAVSVDLVSLPSASVQLVGHAEGAGDPIPLGDAMTVQRGLQNLTLDAPYQAPAGGVRWLTVQAVLGPSGTPLAQSASIPYLVMDVATGAHGAVYYSPSVSADLAQTYASDFDQIWQQVGDALGSYADKQTILLTGDNDTFLQAIQTFGYSAADAAREKSRNVAGINLNSVIALDQTGPNPQALGHEYSETRMLALQPGNQNAGWFWDGLADTLGVRVAAQLADAGCSAQSFPIMYWGTALAALQKGSLLRLADITTGSQWVGQDPSLEYPVGFEAIQYLQSQYGFAAIVQFLNAPKQQASDFWPAIQQVFGVSADQLQQALESSLQQSLAQPAPAIPISIHLDPSGVTPSLALRLISYSDTGQQRSYQTPSGIGAGDYSFQVASDGTATSSDGSVTLTLTPGPVTPGQQGQVYAEILHPTYHSQAGVDGSENLNLEHAFGRAGVLREYFLSTDLKTRVTIPGPCMGTWPDGNQISATLP